jgi:hypothetical protein
MVHARSTKSHTRRLAEEPSIEDRVNVIDTFDRWISISERQMLLPCLNSSPQTFRRSHYLDQGNSFACQKLANQASAVPRRVSSRNETQADGNSSTVTCSFAGTCSRFSNACFKSAASFSTQAKWSPCLWMTSRFGLIRRQGRPSNTEEK